MDHAETQLMALFRSIDRNSDGRLERDELRSAFRKAGVTVPTARLNAFFDELDRNNDGFVTFEEWRYVAISLYRPDKPKHLAILAWPMRCVLYTHA